MDFPHGETVTVLTATTTTDGFGNTVTDWSNPTSVAVDNVAVADGGSLEVNTNAQNITDSDFDLIFPPDATVTAENRVIVRGLTCNVAGRPFLWSNPFTGWTPGLVVKAQIREGG